jgi:hypothetical protein
MFEKCSRDLVSGFLHADGRKIVNGLGEEILLTGWGLGNWLLPEGYMWLAGDGTRFDRPRRIEQVIREVAGSEYAESFWKKFRENYTTESDIKRMAELGHNSVRIPISWRVLMKDEPGIQWIEEGFELISNCLDWCEKHKLYAFLDLHGAPGGQTGANIDDSVDDIPRLFIDGDSWSKAVELWRELARRYSNRWIVGGYDLLNEPLKPDLPGELSAEHLLPKLARFYEECIESVREIDKEHMFTIEGSVWATNTDLFYKRFDPNMAIHFHRYGVKPGHNSLAPYIEASERLNQPLWLGESGENLPAWFAAMYPLSISLGIGYNLWPWKRMEAECSQLSIEKPKGWDEIIAYTHGSRKPSYSQAQETLDLFLENIKCEKCKENTLIHSGIFREPPFTLRATDFDQDKGSHSALHAGNAYNYRSDAGMEIVQLTEASSKHNGFDSGWNQFALRLREGEFASYSVWSENDFSLSLERSCCTHAEAEIIWNGKAQALILSESETASWQKPLILEAGKGSLRINALSGDVLLIQLSFQ